MKINTSLMANRRKIEKNKTIRHAIQLTHTNELLNLLQRIKKIVQGIGEMGEK